MKLRVVDNPNGFQVEVLDGDTIIQTLDWFGGRSQCHTHPFEYSGRFYVVFGPFHEFRGIEDFVLYEMREAARV